MKKQLTFGVLIALSLGFTSLTASQAQEPEPPPNIEILEVEGSFDLLDQKTGEVISEPRDRAELDGDRSTLTQAADGRPVVFKEQFSLDDPTDLESDIAEASEQAGQEHDPAEVVLPEGEEAFTRRDYTPEEVAFDHSLLKPRAAFAITPTSAHFHLTHAEGYDQTDYKYYSVFLNSEVVEVFETPTFVLDGLRPDTEYYYQIVASVEDPRAEAAAEDGYPALTRSIRLLTPPNTFEEAQKNSAALLAVDQYAHGFLHTTFIPQTWAVLTTYMESVGCGVVEPGHVVAFKGDNRGFQTPAVTDPYVTMPTHRTYMYFDIYYWAPAGSQFVTMKHVSPTEKYVDGIHESTLTASDSAATFSSTSGSTTYGQVWLEHKVTNPHCPFGGVTYGEIVRTYRTTDTVEVVGWRWPAPNHELSFRYYMTSSPGSYMLPAYWGVSAGLDCLLGFCTVDNYSQSLVGI